MDDSDSTDDTSIRPVSSLRSRFENLVQHHNHEPSSPLVQRSNTAAKNPDSRHHMTSDARASNYAARASLDLPRPMSFMASSNLSNDHVDHVSHAKKRQPTPPKQRPMSMMPFSSPRPSPPTVNVESPASPPKQFHVNPTTATPSKPSLAVSAPNSAANSPQNSSAAHSRNPSRVTTPALEARMSAFLHAAAHGEDAQVDADRREANGVSKSKAQTAVAPPPVNRAGKPKLANAPAPATDSVDPFDMLTPRNEQPKPDKISPFSTPPSSSDGTPAEQPSPSLSSHPKARASIHMPPDKGYFSAITSQRVLPDHARDRPSEQSMTPISRSFESRPVPPSSQQNVYTARKQSVVSAHDGTDEDTPDLPPRPGRQIQSGRTSPSRQQRIPARRSMDMPRKSSSILVADPMPQFMPPPRRTQQSALLQGFDRTPGPAAVPSKPPPPAVPAPRRSVDTRRDDVRPEPVPLISSINKHSDDYDDPNLVAQGPAPTDFPDASRTNRRPPQFSYRPWEISTGYDTKLFAVCGEFVCTTGYITRAWSLRTGESCLTLAHGEGVKITSLAFKPTPNINEEGRQLWLGTSLGEIHEVDIPTQSVVHTKSNAHPRREIVKIHRHASQMWSLDDEGKLNVWSAGQSGIPSLDTPPRSFRTVKSHSCSVIVGSHLWLASGKDVHIFQANAASDEAFQLLQRPLRQEAAGDITSAATISSKPGLVYFSHADGKVSLYSTREMKCLGVVNVSPYKINSLAGAGDYLWAGFNTGMVYVYDVSSTPWRVMKDWHAHDNPVSSIVTDRQSLWKMDHLQVVTLGLDNMLRIWDGLLEEDWLEARMQDHDTEFCTFEEVTAAVLTWNAGATKPSYLRNDQKDNNFFRDYLTSHHPPDIFIFGFQELVDLEDKKVTAKSFFKSKKKDPTEQEHMSHQYRAWRDHISRCIEDVLSADQAYALVHTASMVGLFSCVFVKTSIRSRIKQVHASEVKRGMGGLHGNKGALIIRMVVDDSSICMVNCHLAAGQTQTINRNNDIASILESLCLPNIASSHTPGTFVGGGDGSMVLDHEICILNGDLNYRIDAMPRDTVVKAVKEKNIAKLLDRDQLLLSRRKNPAFRLRVFQEMPITFAPTYKYNVGTDDYDSSEKKRAPAWCDRILFRGAGRIKCEDYRRWEVRVSDHRPVSARLKIRIKKIDEQKRKQVWKSIERGFQLYLDKIASETKLDYLMNVLGLPKKEAVDLLND